MKAHHDRLLHWSPLWNEWDQYYPIPRACLPHCVIIHVRTPFWFSVQRTAHSTDPHEQDADWLHKACCRPILTLLGGTAAVLRSRQKSNGTTMQSELKRVVIQTELSN